MSAPHPARPSQRDKVAHFQALHARAGAFVIPNPWDAGSARLLANLGFEALATTSAGLASTFGRADGEVSRDEHLEHCRQICLATDLPVSADLENGFADDPAGVADTIRRAAATGLAGGSIEDYSGHPQQPIYPFALAVERVHAAVEAARALPVPFVLTARAENLLRGVGDFDDTVRRLQAFEAVGADVLYAPALTTLDEVRQLTAAVRAPVNVLAPLVTQATVADLTEAGARRISVGGALARAALAALVSAALEMQERGTFGWLSGLPSAAEVTRLLSGASAAERHDPRR